MFFISQSAKCFHLVTGLDCLTANGLKVTAIQKLQHCHTVIFDPLNLLKAWSTLCDKIPNILENLLKFQVIVQDTIQDTDKITKSELFLG